MRPLVPYDLDDPPAAHSDPLVPTGSHPSTGPPPNKKRKRHHHNSRQPPSRKMPVQHWDDPGSTAVGVVYDEEGGDDSSMAVGEDDHDYDEEAVKGADDEASRPLTHDEIWDDSALIDAWNSAQAEYEAYHGTSKDWKTEPVKKSPLWYNKPYTPEPGTAACSKRGPSLYQAQDEDGDLEPDSAPLDFNTYLPTHDPSLAVPSSGPANGTGASAASTAPYFIPPASTGTVSRDEAFQNAMNAMYWTGYWTAVYHCQDHTGDTKDDEGAEADEEDEIDTDKGEDEQDLAPAQR